MAHCKAENQHGVYVSNRIITERCSVRLGFGATFALCALGFLLLHSDSLFLPCTWDSFMICLLSVPCRMHTTPSGTHTVCHEKRLLRLLPLSVTKWGTQLGVAGLALEKHEELALFQRLTLYYPALSPTLTGLRCESPSQHLLHWSTNHQYCEHATNHNAQHLKEHNWMSLCQKQSFRRIHSPLSPLHEWMSMSMDVHRCPYIFNQSVRFLRSIREKRRLGSLAPRQSLQANLPAWLPVQTINQLRGWPVFSGWPLMVLLKCFEFMWIHVHVWNFNARLQSSAKWKSSPILFLEQSQQGSRCRLTWYHVTAPRSCSFYSFSAVHLLILTVLGTIFSRYVFLPSNHQKTLWNRTQVHPSKSQICSRITTVRWTKGRDLLHRGRGPPLSLAAMARGWTLEISRVEANKKQTTKKQNKG